MNHGRTSIGMVGVLAAAFALASVSQAATITWIAYDITAGNGTADVSTAGTLHDARNGATSDVTVNGVVFKSIANSGNLFDSLFANDGISGRAGTNPTNAGGSNYYTFLTTGQRSGRLGQSTPPRIEPTEVWTTVNFSGLTVGNTYEIQIWFTDTNTTLGDAGNTGLLLGNGTGGNPVLGTDIMLLSEVEDGVVAGQYGTAGQYGIGKFVADATTQSFNVRGYFNLLTTPSARNNDHFSNGWQIRDLGVLPVDEDPPTPNPMTWASAPAASGETSITMTATTATDPSGVQYQFTRWFEGSVQFTSRWQDSPEFTDSGLTPGTEYSYTVKARDKSIALNQTDPSASASASTDPADLDPPTPDPMTWASVPAPVSSLSITMTATTATDPNGVQYQFIRWFGGVAQFTSAWQDSPEFTDVSLTPETEYSYTVKARDLSASRNETAPSSPPASAKTYATATITWSASDITDDPASDVSTNGTLVDARTGRLGAGNNVTVNGVTFLSVENSGNLFDSLFANDTIAARGYGNVVTDANYRTFLSYGQRSGRLGSAALPQIEPTEVWTTVNLSGLKVGHAYEIQIWYSDNASTAGKLGLLLGDGSPGGPVLGTDVMLLLEVEEGGAGQYGTGTFVAVAPAQSFNVRGYDNLLTTPSARNNDHFSNGWQVRDLGAVFPPGTLISIF